MKKIEHFRFYFQFFVFPSYLFCLRKAPLPPRVPTRGQSRWPPAVSTLVRWRCPSSRRYTSARVFFFDSLVTQEASDFFLTQVPPPVGWGLLPPWVSMTPLWVSITPPWASMCSPGLKKNLEGGWSWLPSAPLALSLQLCGMLMIGPPLCLSARKDGKHRGVRQNKKPDYSALRAKKET